MTTEEYINATHKFQPNHLTVKTTLQWRVLIRAKQITLGALILLPLNPIDDFIAIDEEASKDLFATIAACQSALERSFKPDRFNLIAAMMKDPFVHFHLIPRYELERTFAGVAWSDTDWPQLVSFRDVNTSTEILYALRDTLANSFGIS